MFVRNVVDGVTRVPKDDVLAIYRFAGYPPAEVGLSRRAPRLYTRIDLPASVQERPDVSLGERASRAFVAAAATATTVTSAGAVPAADKKKAFQVVCTSGTLKGETLTVAGGKTVYLDDGTQLRLTSLQATFDGESLDKQYGKTGRPLNLRGKCQRRPGQVHVLREIRRGVVDELTSQE